MSNRPGNPRVLVNATVALGAAAGQNFALESSNQDLISIAIVYTASASAGTRIPTVRVLDPSSRVLWSAVFATAVTATQVPRLLMGAGSPPVATTNPLQQTFPLPEFLSLPPSCSIQVLDAANIDVADTVQVNIVVVL